MTIEEKAKRYDEAIERAKKHCADYIVETIFPELKESEDERIRKALMQNLKERFGTKGNMGEGLDMPNVLAWLEKQGEKEKDILEDAILDGNEDGLIAETIRYKNEKQGEQNTADKIEPKFHEGEWLCENVPNNYARFIQILEIVNVQGKDRYRISRDIHNDEDIVEFDFVEKYYHKFDIQDAKDGDVLSYVTEEENLWIMIYWSLYEPYEGHVHYHALLVNDNFSDKGTCCICIDDLKPATKEQRDLLFQKMKEAGYMWDAEKKELKKIEQKPAWSEEDETVLNNLIYALANDKIGNDRDEYVNWLKSLRPQNRWKPSDEQMKLLEEACEQLAENARKHKAEILSPFFSQTDYKQGVIDGAKWQLNKIRREYEKNRG